MVQKVPLEFLLLPSRLPPDFLLLDLFDVVVVLYQSVVNAAATSYSRARISSLACSVKRFSSCEAFL